MKKLLILATAAFATLAFQASAETPDQMKRWPHWYIGLQGFVPFVSDSDTEISGVNGPDIDFESGWGGGMSLGYKPGNTDSFIDAMRFEIEYAYRSNDIDTPVGGNDVFSHALMFNAFYDVDTGTKFIPYVGAGIGGAHVNLDAFGADDADSVLAYQGMVGVAYAPETVRNTTVGLGYRYFATQDPSASATGGAHLDYEYQTHNIELNARFGF